MKPLEFKKIGWCESCQTEDVPVRSFTHGTGAQRYYEEKEWDLCYICAHSFIGTSVEYHKDDASVMQAIGFCTNLILKALKQANDT